MLNVRHACALMLAIETLQELHARTTMAALDQRPLAADDRRGQERRRAHGGEDLHLGTTLQWGFARAHEPCAVEGALRRRLQQRCAVAVL
jgi:hypothetical protein